MDVAADDAVGLMAARHRGQRAFVFGDEFDGGLGLGFQIRRQRPIAETEHAAKAVEIQIEVEDPVVEVRAEFFQQMIEMREPVRLMAVDDEIFFSVGGGMDHLPRDGHIPKPHPHELLDELVVIARNINHLGLLAAFAEQFLDEHIVVIAPKPAELQFPAINQIADEIQIFAIHYAQELQQFRYAGVLRAEMDVGDPHGTADDGLVGIQFQVGLVFVHNSRTTRLCYTVNNFGNGLPSS